MINDNVFDIIDNRFENSVRIRVFFDRKCNKNIKPFLDLENTYIGY